MKRGELLRVITGAGALLVRHGARHDIGLVRQPGWLPHKSRKTLRVLRFLAEVVRKLKFPNNSIYQNPRTGKKEQIPRHAEVKELTARAIIKNLTQ